MPYVPVLYYSEFMTESRTQEAIASLIRTAPGWVRAGITEPSGRVRQQAIDSLAEHVAIGLRHVRDDDRDQLPLPF